MEIAIVGAEARALCQRLGGGARAFSALGEAAGHEWDILALTRSALVTLPSAALRARSLLLPGDSGASFTRAIRAFQVVGFGFSPRDTLTLSSLAGKERMLCVQRSILTPDGTLIEPQETPIGAEFASLGEEQALLLAGIRLLCDAKL